MVDSKCRPFDFGNEKNGAADSGRGPRARLYDVRTSPCDMRYVINGCTESLMIDEPPIGPYSVQSLINRDDAGTPNP